MPVKSDAPPDSDVVLAVRAWNMMQGKIDWQALEIVTEIIGITDIECLIAQLESIREYGQQRSQN